MLLTSGLNRWVAPLATQPCQQTIEDVLWQHAFAFCIGKSSQDLTTSNQRSLGGE
jgi:hypothetical protein